MKVKALKSPEHGVHYLDDQEHGMCLVRLMGMSLHFVKLPEQVEVSHHFNYMR